MAEAPEFARPQRRSHPRHASAARARLTKPTKCGPCCWSRDIDTDGAVYPVRRRRRHEVRDVDAARQLPGVVVSLGRTQVRERDGREEERGRTGGQ